MPIIPIILAGGSGSRLAKMNFNKPKQFLNLAGSEPLLSQTVARIDSCFATNSLSKLTIATNANYVTDTQELLRYRQHRYQLIAEPVSKNTAPALTLCAFSASQHSKESILVVLPIDHFISDRTVFKEAINQSIKFASEPNTIALIGSKPHKPSCQYGYIMRHNNQPLASVSHFTEKPHSEQLAQTLINKGGLWNCGVFSVSASLWLSCIQKTHPSIYQLCYNSWQRKKDSTQMVKPFEQDYVSCPKISIDNAVIERFVELKLQLKVTELHCDWYDLGTPESLADFQQRHP